MMTQIYHIRIGRMVRRVIALALILTALQGATLVSFSNLRVHVVESAHAIIQASIPEDENTLAFRHRRGDCWNCF